MPWFPSSLSILLYAKNMLVVALLYISSCHPFVTELCILTISIKRLNAKLPSWGSAEKLKWFLAITNIRSLYMLHILIKTRITNISIRFQRIFFFLAGRQDIIHTEKTQEINLTEEHRSCSNNTAQIYIV